MLRKKIIDSIIAVFCLSGIFSFWGLLWHPVRYINKAYDVDTSVWPTLHNYVMNSLGLWGAIVWTFGFVGMLGLTGYTFYWIWEKKYKTEEDEAADDEDRRHSRY